MSAKIFEGLKVLDFSWAAAGPIVTKQFADNGATVIKVESTRHPDSVRLGGPFKDNKPGINRSGFFADFNSSKMSISVDTNHPQAAEIIKPLVEWADVVAESFRPGIMARWGFDYPRLRAIKPSIIMFSSSLYGADGPWSGHPGYGAQGQALAGIHGLTGWPDRAPAAPKGAYTDSVSPRYGLAALVAALIHRDRTGEGQWLDLSQTESTINLVTPQLLDLQCNGVSAQRQGNANPLALLHGVFPCQGEDNWIAIEVWNADAWSALLGVLGQRGDTSQLQATPASALATQREQLEATVGVLTAAWDAFDLTDALRQAGVAAGKVIKGSELVAEKTLNQRGHFWKLNHPEMGELAYNGPAYRFEATPAELRSAAPCLGEHTEQVLQEILGLTPEQIATYRQEGVLV